MRIFPWPDYVCAVLVRLKPHGSCSLLQYPIIGNRWNTAANRYTFDKPSSGLYLASDWSVDHAS